MSDAERNSDAAPADGEPTGVRTDAAHDTRAAHDTHAANDTHASGGSATPRTRRSATLARILMSITMIGAGTSHLTVAREEFQAQVPEWLPGDPDTVVLASGVAEIALGAGFLLAPRRRRRIWAVALAAFFVAIFPGNISQFVTRTDAFSLNSDAARGVRLLFQPVLVILALWSGGVIGAGKRRR